ncbi:MAG: hypothetical protein Q8P01_02065 [bacterium]|nr:hypothetical protein [bacterium]MDP2703986.1 hypothetical protein [bacterium]
MVKGNSKGQPKKAQGVAHRAKTLKAGDARRRFGVAKFGKDGCGY